MMIATTNRRRVSIQNTSHWPTHFIRRMLAWCICEVDLPAGALRSARFRKKSEGYWSGHAWAQRRRIVVSIGKEGPSAWPVKWSGYKRACRPADGSNYLEITDPVDALVAVTAHELGHIAHFSRGHYGRGSEELADARARYVVRKFREQRGTLEVEWSAAPVVREQAPKLGIIEQRATKAERMLAAWERKLKLAKSKVAKYRRRVGYYERAAAMRGVPTKTPGRE